MACTRRAMPKFRPLAFVESRSGGCGAFVKMLGKEQVRSMQRSSERGFQSASDSHTSPRGGSADEATAGSPRERRGVGRWVAAAALLVAPLLGVSSACLDRPIGSPPPVTTNIFVDKITQTSVDKIDLLFMIDNSISMSDKQDILQLAVPDLVSRLVNPICVDSLGNQEPAPAPGGTGTCRQGFSQEFNPINNINIGVVSSSLGDVGANAACPPEGYPNYVPDRVDLAHLMGSLKRGEQLNGDTPEGFLAWRAGAAGNSNITDFNRNFQTMVRAVGENGCGWEASLESWYRFLVDPFPYRQLARVQCPNSSAQGANCVQPSTDMNNRILLDDVLLAQRAAFLRPDSLVAIIMLTDENDCSTQVGNQTWVVAAIDDARPMFRGSATCAQDANAKCCYSCPLGPPAGCEADPICNANPANEVLQNRLPATQDGKNLRCYQQKRRFGVDFLYPTQRYVNALSEVNICWNALDLSTSGCAPADIQQNPLFKDGRQPSLVFLGGIVGVPWQAIASQNDSNGRPLTNPQTQLRFKNYAELSAPGDTTWAQILGSPGVRWQAAANGKPEVAGSPATAPGLVQMVETEFQRANVTRGNPMNGRDYDTAKGEAANGTPDDLEYACIFPLPMARDCTQRDLAQGDACDCYAGDLDRPLCEQVPGTSVAGTTQFWSKAYPGTRHLQVLKDYGANSIVASICARNVQDENAPDFGYRPAIAAIVDRLKEQLGDRCLPRALLLNQADATVACTLVETTPQPDGACTCDPNIARKVPDEAVDTAIRGQLAVERGTPCGDSDPLCTKACLCEVQQVQQVAGAAANALQICQQDEDAQGVEGWCYIDADQGIGNAALVENCPATQRRKLRFVGRGLSPNTTTFVACTGSSLAARQ